MRSEEGEEVKRGKWRRVLLFVMVLGMGGTEAGFYRFGAIATVKPEIVKRHFQPLLDYLSRETGESFVFATGRDYDDTIDKFVDGTFDLGYMGPSPYVVAKRRAPEALEILAGVESDFTPYFRAVIVSRRDTVLKKLKDLEGKRFAFGSHRSTLSFYLPYYMLYQAGVIHRLAHFDFLGRHDIVVKNVIMGRYDAGGVKMSVARNYKRYLKYLAVSEPITDFAIVAHRSMDPEVAGKIKEALFRLKDPKILHAIKKDMTGFGPRKDSDYNRLREIMEIVDREIAKALPSSSAGREKD